MVLEGALGDSGKPRNPNNYEIGPTLKFEEEEYLLILVLSSCSFLQHSGFFFFFFTVKLTTF